MARSFLIRGMICGIVSGLLAFVFAWYLGEPTVDGAIGVENLLAQAAGEAPEPELVSRAVQSSWGLFTGVMLFSIALGGLFSLVFAFAWGRVGRLGPRATSLLIAGASFVAVYLVPFIKYPANPPSVGDPETIGYRTALYFGLIVISVIAMIAALNLGRALLHRYGAWYASLAGGALYLVLVIVAYVAMPAINEVPDAFPATLLWSFRTVALGIQIIIWTVLGLLFGELTERSATATSRRLGAPPAAPARR